MTRDVARLTAATFDLAVVGGGIYGLTIACDAAQRGLSVALVERGDFGSGTSFNHLRTIHGGLRYLQTLDLPRARESVRERRTLARIAPAALRVLPFVLPVERSLTRGPLAMRAGFALDAVVSRDRNEDVPPSHRLPRGALLARDEARRRYPAIADTGSFEADAVAAAVWHDYVTVDANRLTLGWALAAAAHGATLANYVEATAILADRGRAVGVHAIDRIGGGTLDLSARVVVNAAGAAMDALLASHGAATNVPMLKAMNLVTSRPAADVGIGGSRAGGRALFMVPSQGRALFGTWESRAPCAPGDTSVQESEVAAFIADLNAAFPACRLSLSDVTLVHRGVVPAVPAGSGGVALAGHEVVRDHAQSGLPGLISVAGAKYTTARAVAERIADKVLVQLGRSPVPCRTAATPLPWTTLDGDALLVAAVRDEMAVKLTDVVARRTPLGALGHPGDAAVAHTAAVVGRELGWDDERRRKEIDDLRAFYRAANVS